MLDYWILWCYVNVTSLGIQLCLYRSWVNLTPSLRKIPNKIFFLRMKFLPQTLICYHFKLWILFQISKFYTIGLQRYGDSRFEPVRSWDIVFFLTSKVLHFNFLLFLSWIYPIYKHFCRWDKFRSTNLVYVPSLFCNNVNLVYVPSLFCNNMNLIYLFTS